MAEELRIEGPEFDDSLLEELPEEVIQALQRAYERFAHDLSVITGATEYSFHVTVTIT